MNSLPINSDSWEYVIYIGLGYLYSHLFSIDFDIGIALFLLCCIISNHPVIGSIIVTAF